MPKKRAKIKGEYTVILVKPDGVRRGLVGEIIMRFEKVGFKILAAKMVWVDETHAGKHYADDNAYHKNVGEKSLKNYKKYGFDAQEKLGTMDPIEVGRIVRKWNMEFISSGPVFVLLLGGHGAVPVVRKIVGFTFPNDAVPGTIRGDYSYDSTYEANLEGRPAHNLIHASGTKEEAEFERKLWFKETEIFDY